MPAEVEYRLIAWREGKLDPRRGRKVINLTSYEARLVSLTRMIHDHACTHACVRNPSVETHPDPQQRDDRLHATRLSPRKDYDEFL